MADDSWALGWVALGGIAQLLAAAGTVYLALATRRMADKTRALAEETKQLAKDTKQEATATEALAAAARTDRELTWRPQLSLTRAVLADPASFRDVGGLLLQVDVASTGPGPALDCSVVFRMRSEIGTWGRVALGDRAPRTDSGPKWILRSGEMSPYDLYSGLAAGTPADPAPDVLIFATDVLGRRWRFPVRVLSKEDSNREDFPERWKRFPSIAVPAEGDPDQQWSMSPLIWAHE